MHRSPQPRHRACCAGRVRARHAAPFDVEGHRGARGLAPENTLAAFERALALGVTTLETDLAVTRDDVVVCRTTRGSTPTSRATPTGRFLAAEGPRDPHADARRARAATTSAASIRSPRMRSRLPDAAAARRRALPHARCAARARNARATTRCASTSRPSSRPTSRTTRRDPETFARARRRARAGRGPGRARDAAVVRLAHAGRGAAHRARASQPRA